MRIVQLQGARREPGPADGRRRAGARAAPRAEAADLLASAQREADQLRLAAQQEINELRTGAQREAEQSRAAVDREVQEARRMLAVEKERLAREATDHHTSALAETKRLVEEAEERADVRRGAGPRGDRSRPPRHRSAGADRGRGHPQPGPARGRADRRRGAAPRPSRSSPAATPRSERQLAALRAEVDRMAKRRDAITAQLASLRDVVAGFGEDEDA